MEDSPRENNATASESAARRHVDWLVERNQHDPGIDLAHAAPRPIRSVVSLMPVPRVPAEP